MKTPREFSHRFLSHIRHVWPHLFLKSQSQWFAERVTLFPRSAGARCPHTHPLAQRRKTKQDDPSCPYKIISTYASTPKGLTGGLYQVCQLIMRYNNNARKWNTLVARSLSPNEVTDANFSVPQICKCICWYEANSPKWINSYMNVLLKQWTWQKRMNMMFSLRKLGCGRGYMPDRPIADEVFWTSSFL